MSLVIGLHGSKGSGKDYFFKVVKEAFPHLDVRKIAYADPIKNEVLNIFDLRDEQEYDLFKRTNMTYSLTGYVWNTVPGRHVVREIGMLMRKYDQQQFVKYVEDQIKANPQAIWCVTDLRFDNELQSIKDELDGIVIKIKRSGFDYDGHVTETELPDDVCSTVIHNDGTINEYQQKVIDTMTSLLQTLSVN